MWFRNRILCHAIRLTKDLENILIRHKNGKHTHLRIYLALREDIDVIYNIYKQSINTQRAATFDIQYTLCIL